MSGGCVEGSNIIHVFATIDAFISFMPPLDSRPWKPEHARLNDELDQFLDQPHEYPEGFLVNIDD
jgi:hypothetical protein